MKCRKPKAARRSSSTPRPIDCCTCKGARSPRFLFRVFGSAFAITAEYSQNLTQDSIFTLLTPSRGKRLHLVLLRGCHLSFLVDSTSLVLRAESKLLAGFKGYWTPEPRCRSSRSPEAAGVRLFRRQVHRPQMRRSCRKILHTLARQIYSRAWRRADPVGTWRRRSDIVTAVHVEPDVDSASSSSLTALSISIYSS